MNGRLIQITGLPRSGTAFMATVMMLHPDCNVFHEAAADGTGWRDRIEESRERYPITADCGTYQFIRGFTTNDSDKVFLSRPYRESADACAVALDSSPDYSTSLLLREQAFQWIETYEVRSFGFNGLFNVDTIRDIWTHLKLGKFPENKVAQLVRMRITRKDVELFSLENAVNTVRELQEV
jgi:hypothetical protein